MLKKFIVLFSLLLIIRYTVYGTPDSVTIDTVTNYHGWGWDVLVVSNNYITLSIVPSIGARVLQYDLGTDTFMIVNESLLGEVFYDPSPTPWDGNWGYGGYKTWPAPQSIWNWPPPPTLAWGNYEYEVTHASNDSVVIWMKGQTETVRTPGLRFDRYMVAYRNSSHIKVTTVLFNDSDSEQDWSIWEVTQTIVQHGNDNDYANFSAYFPAAQASDVWGSGPYYEEVLPGVYRVKYVSTEGKISTATSEGWACFVDERDQQTYAKVFDLIKDAEYTHNGASVEFYTNGSTRYMEVEVLGPYETIGPDGDSIVFVEDWYTTRTSGPIYTANRGGLVREKLDYNRQTKEVTGEFGIFNEGELRLKFLNSEGNETGEGSSVEASPDTLVQLTEAVELPPLTESIELQAYDVDGSYIDRIDKVNITTDDSFFAYKALEFPVIDGLATDECWDTARWYPLDFVWLPYNDYVAPEDFTGRFKLSWTNERLLLLVEVIDDVLYDGHPDPLQNYWDDDCVEVFLDEDHSGGDHLYNFNAFAYHVSTTFDVVDNGPSGPALFNSHIDAAMSQTDSLYTWELSIKVFDDSYSGESSIPVILSDGKEMGYSLAYCDNDGSPSRENFIGSKYLPESESNNSYINASLFGTLTLIDPLSGPDYKDPGALMKEENIMVYPNPTSGMLYYRFENFSQKNFNYQINDLTGQTIMTGTITDGFNGGYIDLSRLSKGVYFINFQTNHDVVSKRIVLL